MASLNFCILVSMDANSLEIWISLNITSPNGNGSKIFFFPTQSSTGRSIELPQTWVIKPTIRWRVHISSSFLPSFDAFMVKFFAVDRVQLDEKRKFFYSLGNLSQTTTRQAIFANTDGRKNFLCRAIPQNILKKKTLVLFRQKTIRKASLLGLLAKIKVQYLFLSA